MVALRLFWLLIAVATTVQSRDETSTQTRDEDVIVETKVGTFIGHRQSVGLDDNVVSISKFLGIPFAEQPIGELRFRKPVPKANLQKPLVTKTYGPECIQMEFFPTESPTSEDCLFLNIYAPSVSSKNEKLAVMVWIHGGAFVMGSANIYHAEILAASGNVIVVTVNYRLSVLGFLNVGGDSSRGNYGLWDQHLALKWVHEHIGAFGGDINRVTIFGESAGGASAVFQALYPGNKGLFQRIIAQSGTALAPWAFTRSYKEEAKEFATLAGCKTENTKEMVECLRNIDADSIRSTLNDFSNGLLRIPFPLGPSADGEMVKVSPDEYSNLYDGNAEESRATFATFDVLIGINEAEGAGFINPIIGIEADPDTFLPNRTYFNEVLVPIALKPLLGENIPSVLKELTAAEYTNWNDPENPTAIREQYVNLQGDINMFSPLYSTVSAHAGSSDRGLYVYHFAADPSVHVLEAPKWLKKPKHGDELQFVFGGGIDFKSWGSDFVLNQQERKLSKRIMSLWTNFAKSGNPNTPRDLGLGWGPYTRENPRYLDITHEMGPASVKERLNERRANFLTKLLPAVNKALKHGTAARYTVACELDGGCSP